MEMNLVNLVPHDLSDCRATGITRNIGSNDREGHWHAPKWSERQVLNAINDDNVACFFTTPELCLEAKQQVDCGVGAVTSSTIDTTSQTLHGGASQHPQRRQQTQSLNTTNHTIQPQLPQHRNSIKQNSQHTTYSQQKQLDFHLMALILIFH